MSENNDNLVQDLRKQLQKAWDEEIESDEVEPDFELISAFLEGELNPDQEAYLGKIILESPRTFDLLLSQLEPGQSLPPVPNQAEYNSSERIYLNRNPENGKRNHWRVSFWSAATIITTVFVVGVSTTLFFQSSELNLLRSQVVQLKRSHNQLLTFEKVQLAQAASSQKPIYLGGLTSGRLVSLAISPSSNVRGAEPTEEEKQELHDALASIEKVVDSLPGPDSQNSQRDLEKAIALTWAGNYDAADELLNALEKIDDSPKVINARGVWFATRADQLLKEEHNKSMQQAESKFREAAEKGIAEAWLNLSLMFLTQGRQSEAIEAARHFVSETKDVSAAAAVRKWLGV